MLQNIGVGCLLTVLTTIVHAVAMVVALRGLKILRAGHWGGKSGLTRVAVISTLVLMMFAASIVEACLWAGTYLFLGAISGAEPALYFSVVTYTTLGYGDILMSESWRLLAAFEAVNGILMFGWTTALVVAAVHKIYVQDMTKPPEAP
jgi:hypothetical protein